MIKLVPGLFHNEQATKQALCDFIMNTDRLSIGPECEKFEAMFTTWQKRKHTVLFNSGSSANLALIQALINLGRINPPNKAAFSAITWATNVMPLVQLGLTPLPIDVELSTLNVSSHTLELALDENPETKLLFLTNLLGFCSDIDVIKQLCDARDIILIEDNCESLGSVYQGIKLGNWSLASTFSFFVGHHISTVEGGAVCTDDVELARMLKLVRAHGWDRNLNDEEKINIRQTNHVPDDFFTNFTFYTLGYNLRPTEITAFLGLQQMQYADQIINQRHQNFERLQAALAANPDTRPLKVDHLDVVSAFAMPVICHSRQLAAQYIKRFQASAVEIRPIVGGSIPEQPFYINRFGPSSELPNAHLINQQGFYFGNHEGLSEHDIEQLCSLCHPMSIDSQVVDNQAMAAPQ